MFTEQDGQSLGDHRAKTRWLLAIANSPLALMKATNMRRLIFLGILVSTALVTACSPPKLGKPVDLPDLIANEGKFDGEYITTTGLIRMSGGIMASTTCDGSSCKIELLRSDFAHVQPGVRFDIRLEVSTGSGENEMERLPDKYSKADLKIRAMGGKLVGYDANVKVSGKERCKKHQDGSDYCFLDVDRIDAL